VTTIFDIRMYDGSRHFGSLPETVSVTEADLSRLRAHANQLRGAKVVKTLTDNVTEAWLDFDHAGHLFSMNNQNGEWWFFVVDPACPDDILRAVLGHFATLLTRG
jgi:hypothetical protein